MLKLALCYTMYGALAAWLLAGKYRYDRARNSIYHRIHVGGFGDRSRATRYVTAILRDSGLRTFAKTDDHGSKVILSDGRETGIRRNGFNDLQRHLRLVFSFARRGAQAVVMGPASNALFREWLQRRVLRPQLLVLTGVDSVEHRDGDRPESSFGRMLRGIPAGSSVIAAGEKSENLEALKSECLHRGLIFVEAPLRKVRQSMLKRFGDDADKQSVAIGLIIADIFGVPGQQALASMAGRHNAKQTFDTAPYDPTQRISTRLQVIMRQIDATHRTEQLS